MRASPVVFVAFDLLYVDGASLMDEPLRRRRAALAPLVAAAGAPRLFVSDGLERYGRALFEQVTARGVEGIVAKLLDSPYLPGQRTDAWTKIKAERRVHCAVLGFARDDAGALKSLIVGTDVEGELRCVGKVGSGLTGALRARLQELLEAHPAAAPLVPCGEHVGDWVAPGFYCTVAFLEFTRNGTLRAPVFVRWHDA
jgi:ATP-dependent DNA ligase